MEILVTNDPRKIVLLAVDDEPANLRTFARVFRTLFEVKTAASASAAQEELRRGPVDVVFSDYAMPTMDGIELLRVIQERWPAVLRLIVSGHHDLPALCSAKQTGLAAEVFHKPWDEGEIIEKITSHLNRPRFRGTGSVV